MYDDSKHNYQHHFLDHHSTLFFHHHMKMFVKFFKICFVNYKVPKYDSEKVSDGYFESKLAQKKYEGGGENLPRPEVSNAKVKRFFLT